MIAAELLKDRRVLVVEDEYLVADTIERGLRRAGAIVLGPVPSVAEALLLLEREADIDGAILDINLGDHKVFPVADRLLARGTACVFATGNGSADLPAAYAHIVRLEKPVNARSIVEALSGHERRPHTIVPAEGHVVLEAMHEHILLQISLASDAGETLIAAKLSEVLAAIESRLLR